MQALVNDLTNFSRAGLGMGIPIVPQDVDLAVVCGEELAELRVANAGRTLELSVEGDCRGRWDPQRLRQLVCNLATNALKYGDPSTPVHVRVTGTATEVQLEVGNHGPTIPPGDLQQIFEPLNRGSTAPSEPGLGLGLYIVREIARSHGGTVEGRSASGSTVFTARLPKAGAPAAAPA